MHANIHFNQKNLKFKMKHSIIIILTVTGSERIVEQLIDSGAEVNSVNKLNSSALILATQSGKHVECFKKNCARESL